MDSISQVKYWLGSAGNAASDLPGVEEGGEGATYLDYNILLGLSVLGGFFGLDHLYLRSPVTFLAKFIVNIFCFGIWWIFDATQVIFNRDVVKLYGLGVPGWGPTGIGAGVLTKDVADKKHLRFLFYSAALFFGGFIGMDSFMVGDRQTGIIRLLCAISIILSPIALLWWAYGLFQFFTNTTDVINDHNEFFGAPKYSFSDKMRKRFPFLGWLFSPIESIKAVINNIVGPALLEPITKTAQSAIDTVDHAVSAVDGTIQLGREAVAKSGDIIEQVGKTIETLSQASTMLPAASLYAAAQEGLKGAQSGGSATSVQKVLTGGTGRTGRTGENLNSTPYLLLVLIGIVALSGYVVTWYRSRNVKREQSTDAPRDDTPPQPGVLRGSH